MSRTAQLDGMDRQGPLPSHLLLWFPCICQNIPAVPLSSSFHVGLVGWRSTYRSYEVVRHSKHCFCITDDG